MSPPPAEDIAYIRGKLESLAAKVEEQHSENREAHQGIFKRLDSIERQPMIVFGDDFRGICRSFVVTALLALSGWLAYLWARFHRL
jgi:hypothetical protein